MRNGRSFGLDCKSNGYPTPSVRWKVPGAVDKKDYIIKDGKLEVHRSKDSHRGTYECISQNIGGNITKAVNVTVLGKSYVVTAQDFNPLSSMSIINEQSLI